MNSLPNEMLLHIFRYLDLSDLDHINRVCERFRLLTCQDEFISPLWESAQKIMGHVDSKFLRESQERFEINPWKEVRALRQAYCGRIPSSDRTLELACFGIGATSIDNDVLDFLCVKRALRQKWREWAEGKKSIKIDPTWHFSKLSFDALLEEIGEVEELTIPWFVNPNAWDLIARFERGDLKIRKLVLTVRFLGEHVVPLFQSMKELKQLNTLHVTYIKCDDTDMEAIADLITTNRSIEALLIRCQPSYTQETIANFYAAVKQSSIKKLMLPWV